MLELWDVEAASLSPVFGLLVTTWAARAALEHGGPCVTPRVTSWLCVGATLLFDRAEAETFFQRYETQLLKTHTVTPNPY